MRHPTPRLRHTATWLVLCGLAGGCALEPQTVDDTPELAAPLRVDVRWGRPSGVAVNELARSWDGAMHLDCGEVRAVAFLDPETADGDGVIPHHRSGRETTVRWRSLVRHGQDGVSAEVRPCAGDPGSTLLIRAPGRSWSARLSWTRDDFVSLPVGRHGERLEIRIRPVSAPTLPQT